jgi:putative hydrolase of the HAD superfamily
MKNFSSLKNILFDLGGVILDLNVGATLEHFLNLGFPKELLNYPENYETDIFFNYETGKTSTDQFRDAIRQKTGVNFSNEEFDVAWCAMLTGVPESRTRLLKSLAKQYNLYILSNTSDLHIRQFNQMFHDAAGYKLSDIFTYGFYSHETGWHKPDPGAFKHVLRKAKIKASETLFLDDNIHNVKAAKELGFNVIHITENLRMEDVGFDR